MHVDPNQWTETELRRWLKNVSTECRLLSSGGAASVLSQPVACTEREESFAEFASRLQLLIYSFEIAESHGRLEIEQGGIDRASQGEHEGLKWEALMTMGPADGRGAGEVQ